MIQAAVVVMTSLTGVSCMNTYDAYGRPVQSVDPGVAVAGAAAAGLIGYSAGRDQNRSYQRSSYYHRPPVHRGVYRAYPSRTYYRPY
jgi:hypothetical protein